MQKIGREGFISTDLESLDSGLRALRPLLTDSYSRVAENHTTALRALAGILQDIFCCQCSGSQWRMISYIISLSTV